MNMNRIVDINRYIENIKTLVPLVPLFNYLKIEKNKMAYSELSIRQKYAALNQISHYFSWIRNSFLYKFFEKFGLKINRISLVNSTENLNEVKLDIIEEKIPSTCDDLRHKLSMYQRKELTNLSE